MDALKLIAQSSMKADMPKVEVGDYVRVNVLIREGDKERIQAFEGTVIAMKHGGISETFTVRRVAHGVGIERVFPIHSPRVASVDVLRHGVVRRAKLYYLRNRVGKAARVKEKIVYFDAHEEEGGGNVSFFCYTELLYRRSACVIFIYGKEGLLDGT